MPAPPLTASVTPTSCIDREAGTAAAASSRHDDSVGERVASLADVRRAATARTTEAVAAALVAARRELGADERRRATDPYRQRLGRGHSHGAFHKAAGRPVASTCGAEASIVTEVTPVGTTKCWGEPSLPLVPLYENVHVSCEPTLAHPAAEAVPGVAATSIATTSAPLARTERPTLAPRRRPSALILIATPKTFPAPRARRRVGLYRQGIQVNEASQCSSAQRQCRRILRRTRSLKCSTRPQAGSSCGLG